MFVCMCICMHVVCIYAHSMFIGLLLSNQNFEPEPGLPGFCSG